MAIYESRYWKNEALTSILLDRVIIEKVPLDQLR